MLYYVVLKLFRTAVCSDVWWCNMMYVTYTAFYKAIREWPSYKLYMALQSKLKHSLAISRFYLLVFILCKQTALLRNLIMHSGTCWQWPVGWAQALWHSGLALFFYWKRTDVAFLHVFFMESDVVLRSRPCCSLCCPTCTAAICCYWQEAIGPSRKLLWVATSWQSQSYGCSTL